MAQFEQPIELLLSNDKKALFKWCFIVATKRSTPSTNINTDFR